MGVDFLDPNQDYQWPLALGGADVKLTSMVSAFGVFANTGVRHPVNSILKVENADGEVLEEWKENSGEEVLDPQVAYLINNILSDKEVRLGENMTIPGKNNGAKTGTSNRKTKSGKYLPHDLLCIGYTPSLVTGVWAGNNSDNEGDISIYADGYNISAPIWKKFMTEALKDKPSENFPVPEGIKQVTISKATGKLPSASTPADQQRLEVFASFSVPTEIDNSEVEAEIDTRNNKLSNQYCPPSFVKKVTFVNIHDVAPYPEWEKGALEWMQANMAAKMQEQGGLGNVIYGVPPDTESELCNENVFKSKPEVSITEPNSKSQIAAGSNFDVNVKVSAENGMKKVEYYLDDQYQYFSDSIPYTGKLRLPKGEKSGARHIITARAIDNFGYSSDTTIEITTGSGSDSETSNKSTTSSGSDTTALDVKAKQEPSPESLLPPVSDAPSVPTI
jgi:membrane carboxypeptidase/penicillin-binding protein PbpC